jgi:hypothetical protein
MLERLWWLETFGPLISRAGGHMRLALWIFHGCAADALHERRVVEIENYRIGVG